MGADRGAHFNRRDSRFRDLTYHLTVVFLLQQMQLIIVYVLTYDDLYVIILVTSNTKGAMPMTKMKSQLIELLQIHGISGQEDDICDYLYQELYDEMDTVEIDVHGNLLAEKNYGNGDSEEAVILLSAHMDTVFAVLPNRRLIVEDDIIHSDRGALGADDRAGIAIILEVIRQLREGDFNGKLKVAFSREEEIGCIGSQSMSTDWLHDIDLAIVVDRRANRDIVIGNVIAFCSDEVGEFMEYVADTLNQSDWACVEGGMSDAAIFATRGINTVNLSAGYYDEHTAKESVSLLNMEDTVGLIMQALKLVEVHYHSFGQVPDYNKWLKQSTTLLKDQLPLPEAISPDHSIEVYGVSGGDLMLKQEEMEIFMTEENLLWLIEKYNQTERRGSL